MPFAGVHGIPSDLAPQERVLSRMVQSRSVPIHVSIYCDRTGCPELTADLADSLRQLEIQASNRVESPRSGTHSILLVIGKQFQYSKVIAASPFAVGTLGIFPFLEAYAYRAVAFRLDSDSATPQPEAANSRPQIDLDPDASQLYETLVRDDSGDLLALGDVAVVSSADSHHQMQAWESTLVPTAWIGSESTNLFMVQPGYLDKFETSIVKKIAIESLIDLLRE